MSTDTQTGSTADVAPSAKGPSGRKRKADTEEGAVAKKTKKQEHTVIFYPDIAGDPYDYQYVMLNNNLLDTEALKTSLENDGHGYFQGIVEENKRYPKDSSTEFDEPCTEDPEDEEYKEWINKTNPYPDGLVTEKGDVANIDWKGTNGECVVRMEHLFYEYE